MLIHMTERKKSSRATGIIAAVLMAGVAAVLWVVVSGGGDDDKLMDPTIVATIEAAPDCPTVQAHFDDWDAASDRVEAGSIASRRAVAYMGVAVDRGKELDCPGF